jgi:septal ring factor EnvC (AmiA/AmiB activator)
MTLGASPSGPVRGLNNNGGEERAALEGMLKGYPVDQLVEEVLIAWQELSEKNEELVTSKQRLRILELDLAEREDEIAPEVAQLQESISSLDDAEARIVHLERLLDDAKSELVDNRASLSSEQ